MLQMYREAIMRHYRESKPCAVSKDEWDTKGGHW